MLLLVVKMVDKIETTMEQDRETELRTRAKPIQDMLDMAHSRLSYLRGFDARFALDKIVRCLEVFPNGERGFGGISIYINVKPITNSSLPIGELPGVVADIKGLEYVLRRGILGVEREGGKPVPMFDRLYILSNLCSSRSVIGTHLVKAATEEGFLIVARNWLEEAFAEGQWERFNFALRMAIEIAETIPKRDGEKLEFFHKMADVGEDVRIKCSHAQALHQEGLTVDAPKFEKRPVPKPETSSGKTRKPIKR